MEAWNVFIKEWPTLRAAGVSAVSLALACFAFGWFVGRFMYGQRIHGLKDALHNADRKIADYKDKLNGATPDEIKAIIKDLEHRISRLQPSEMTPDQCRKFSDALAEKSGQITFAVSMMGAGNTKIPDQLRAIFDQRAWKVDDAFVVGPLDTSPSGLALYISSDPDHLPMSLDIKNALDAAGIQYAIYKHRLDSANQSPQLNFAQPTS